MMVCARGERELKAETEKWRDRRTDECMSRGVGLGGEVG